VTTVPPTDATSTDEPLLSIITPCLNRADFIREAVESVLDQDHPRVEHVVIDGGSTDGTLAVLEEYPHLRVVSEPDEGLYDAINKGIRLSRGALIGHLNSDDRYAPRVFRRVVDSFQRSPWADAVAGGAEFFEESGGDTRVIHAIDDPSVKWLRLSDVTRGVPVVNARFFRRSLYEAVGFYDTRYTLAADREFLLRVLVAGMRTAAIEGVVYCYRQHEDSLTIGSTDIERMVREHLEICERYMHDSNAPPSIATECRRWRSQQFAWMLRDRFESRELRDGLRWASRAFRTDPLWPLRYIAQGFGRRHAQREIR
jgi:glycosyltransferase involved in cell wall biosynthesis